MDPDSRPGFPRTRLRRLRQNPAIRRLVRRVELAPSHLILPLFVHWKPGRQAIGSMPGQFQFGMDEIVSVAGQAADAGLGGILLFGIPRNKTAAGGEATSDEGVVPQAVRAVKRAVPQLLVMTDVCLCEYTDHGHCGILSEQAGRTVVDNDATLPILAAQAEAHARAGADVVAPSGMMDGMVGAIRGGLDAAGFEHVAVMSYAAKYASAFYGPFREAAENAPRSGDRRGYQMDPAGDYGLALREVALDLAEGADLVMVKPALAYLDIVREVRRTFAGVPVAAYNVSGEYSMVKAAADRGWIDERATVLESLAAMRRAGADIVITYWALEVAHWL